MRVLHISSARTFGGGERHFVDLTRGLAARGHDVFVALRPTSEWQSRLDFLPPGNILRVSIRNSFGVLSAMKIGEFVRENDLSIVHAHVARDYIPASIACLAAGNAKFVLTRHVHFPLKPFNRFALKNLSRAIAVSDAVGQELLKVFDRENVSVVHNGIDVGAADADFIRQQGEDFRSFHKIPGDAPLVGTLGELKELKGQRDFILAASELLKRVSDARFVIVGRDNTLNRAFRRELRRLASVLEIDDRILWLDWLEDTAPFYSALNVFVSPSHSESFGLAILEAMLAGKAVVATATAGARELFGNVCGCVPVRDPVALASAVEVLLLDRDEQARIGGALLDRAAVKFSLTRMIDEVENIYRNL